MVQVGLKARARLTAEIQKFFSEDPSMLLPRKILASCQTPSVEAIGHAVFFQDLLDAGGKIRSSACSMLRPGATNTLGMQNGYLSDAAENAA
jgi:hypothetical protein